MEDRNLLEEYARSGSEEAFDTIAARYTDLVYSACRRQLRDPSLAEDATQAVFLTLAKKAKTLPRGVVLAGWLFRTARFVSAAVARGEARRKKHEAAFAADSRFGREAVVAMMEQEGSASGWKRVSPLLDEALMNLSEKNRNAVILRFFEQKSHADVGKMLGISEDAARHSVTRALEKVRKFFSKRSVSLSGMMLAGLITHNAVQAAPVSLSVSYSSVALAGAAGGAAVSAKVASAASDAVKMMLWAKMKTVALMCAAVIAAGGIGAAGYSLLQQKDTSRLLLGFEKEECSKWAASIGKRGDTMLFYTAPPHQHRKASEIVPVRSGDATEGKSAYVLELRAGAAPRLRQFYTNGWFRKAFPSDWSGYDVLRIDVKTTSGEIEFLVGIEDEDSDPPLERRFTIGPGEWTTVEVDLERAAAERGTDLTRMFNMWIYPLRSAAATDFFIDNIRLDKRDAPAALSVLRDKSPYQLPALPAGILRREPVREKPDAAAFVPEEPSIIDFSGEEYEWMHKVKVKSFGINRRGIAAFDNKRLAVSFRCVGIEGGGDRNWRGLIWTTDGGKTWRSPEGKNKPLLFINYGRALGMGGSGPDLFFISNEGSGWSGDVVFPGAAMKFKMAMFKGDRWEMTPSSVVSRSSGAGGGGACFALRLDTGRIWASWCQRTRYGNSSQVQAKFSDNGGKTWHSWRPGKTSSVSKPSRWLSSSTPAPLAQYGENVACFWNAFCSFFDGETWSEPHKWTKKGGYIVNSTVTMGSDKKEIFVYGTLYDGKGIVARWDGSDWKQEKVPGIVSYPGLLTVSGDKLVLVGVDTPMRRKKKYADTILMSVRGKDGTWSEAKVVSAERAKISNIAVPLESPPNFVPVAWTAPFKPKERENDDKKMMNKWIKVLKVPVE